MTPGHRPSWRGTIWWVQFYVNGQRVRLSSESTEESDARTLLKDKLARVTLGEPLIVRSARITYEELRTDLFAHYEATGSRDLAAAGWRLKHLDRAFRGVRASSITGPAIARTSCSVSGWGRPTARPTARSRCSCEC